jgi:hypothetical protein
MDLTQANPVGPSPTAVQSCRSDECGNDAMQVAASTRASTQRGPAFRAKSAAWLAIDAALVPALLQHACLLAAEMALGGPPAMRAAWTLLFEVCAHQTGLMLRSASDRASDRCAGVVGVVLVATGPYGWHCSNSPQLSFCRTHASHSLPGAI